MDLFTFSPTVLVSAAVLALTLVVVFVRSKPKSDLPPGPKGLPIVGNAPQLPSQHTATYLKNLHEKHGGLVYLNLAGQPLYAISDLNLAKELLEKRSALASARPALPLFVRYFDPDGMYWGIHTVGDNLFHGRKVSAAVMHAVKAGQSDGLQRLEALVTVRHLLKDGGKNWYQHMNRAAASGVLGAMFGVHFPNGDEPEMHNVLGMVKDVVSILAPESSIVNFIPSLDYIPGSMPWRKRGAEIRKRDKEVYRPLITEAVSGSRSSINTWTAEFAKYAKPGHDRAEYIKPFSVAAIDTTASSLHIFVLACMMHPEFIKMAQQEIDSVVGSDRLPTIEDRPRLPYVEAVMREVFRWRPSVRLGLPRESQMDDVIDYNGHKYFIPKGSLIFYNVLAMEHDETRYPEPDIFRPERFLDERGALKGDYETTVFGFGKRVCVGPVFAERTIFVDLAIFLWTFNIRRSTDPDPKTGLPFVYDDTDTGFEGGFTNGPHPFPAVFEPRDPERVAVALREWEDCEKDLSVLLPQVKKSD